MLGVWKTRARTRMHNRLLMEDAFTAHGIRPSDLPAPPKDAIRVVQACSRSDTGSRDLAAIVANDPVLTAELLRVANSAFFGLASQVRSVARAVTVLGDRALRNLVLCIAMRDALRAESIPGFDIDAFWEDALLRAVAARSLAAPSGLDADECFTVGLLQDFGLLVMFYLQPQHVGEWERLRRSEPDARRELEQALFQTTHDEVGLALATSWGLPEDLATAMGHHHRSNAAQSAPQDALLCRLALCADWMAAVYRCEDKRGTIQRTRRVLHEHFATTDDDCDQLLKQVTESLSEAASAMGMRISLPVDFEQVLREANLRLVEDNLSYQELTWRLEQALLERDHIAAELQKELQLAREVQKSLLPATRSRGIAGLNLSARAVSGDFYDYFALADGRIVFCLADVSGKGMQAALLMAKTASLFRCLGKGVSDPGKLLAMLNREIFETSVRGMFVTMQAGVFDPRRGQVLLSSAGHPPALHMIGTASVSAFPAQAPPLGINPDTAFPNETVELRGGCLYLYTDGLLEARVGEQRLQGDGLADLLRRHSHLPPDARARAIAGAVVDNSGGVEDDLTLLIIEDERPHV